MTKSVKLNAQCWEKLYNRLKLDYPASYVLIREKTKKTLGFTVREYYEYQPGMVHKKYFYFLDFYDESKKTFFLLKYGEYIGNDSKYQL